MKAEAMKRAITSATRVASNDDSAGNGGKNDGDGDKGVGGATTRAMAAATTVTAMRVASHKEDKGAGRATMRAMAAATTVVAMRVASNKEGEGGKAMETDMVGGGATATATKRAVAMATRVAGEDAMANGSTMVMFFFRVGI